MRQEKHVRGHLSPVPTVAVVTSHMLGVTLRQLGVREGGVLIVHASLSALGYVVHGADAVVQALRRTVGPDGTLLVPAFTGASTDPSCWVDPALPAALWEEVRRDTPLFDRERSLPRLMGQVAVRLLLDPDSRRSDHPLASFCALGPRADELVRGHDLGDPFGPQSPLARARELGAQVLLLGVNQCRNSALMHAHCLADSPDIRRGLGPFLAGIDGEREWVTPERMVECTDGYDRIEDELVSRGFVRVARVGDGTLRLMEMGPLVDYARHRIRLRPDLVRCGSPRCRQCAG